jgi:putative ABC transport system substrate-binding protein
MNRRDTVLALLAIGTTPLAAFAQQEQRVRRIAYLTMGIRVEQTELLIKGLAELGWQEGKNLTIDWREAKGNPEQLSAHIKELVESEPELIVAATSITVVPLRRATSRIPIVVIASHDGMGTGFYQSLAKPGGNITGTESLAPDLDAKRLEFIREILPKARRVALIFNRNDPGGERHLAIARSAGASIRMTVRGFPFTGVQDFETLFKTIAAFRADAIVPVAEPVTFQHRKRIAELGLQNHISVFAEFKEFAESGALASYGPDLGFFYYRAATYVDKILKGAKPGDLPVEQPTRFEFVLNQNVAKAMGIKFPQSILVRADRVIE